MRLKIQTRFLTLCAVCFPANAANPWLKLSTPHFQLFTTAGENQGRAIILHFEQVRDFFLRSSPFATTLNVNPRIIAFQSEEQYRPYRINPGAPAYYARDGDRDYIAMRDLEPGHYRYAVHEYTHLVLAHSGLHIPLWMNEGWAELNSTLKAKGKKALAGDIIPEHRDTLLRGEWMPLEDLEKVDQRSPVYNEQRQAGVFYAESWAFMHMLFLSSAYMHRFDAFVRSIVAGKGIDASCKDVFGKSAAQVGHDLQQYLQKDKLYGALFDIELTPSEEEVHVMEGDGPDLQESLAFLSLKAGDRAGAMAHIQRALDTPLTDSRMYYRLAMSLRLAGDERTAVIRTLRQALAIDPDYTEARLQLGIALLETEDYDASLKELQRIRKVPEPDALWLFCATAVDEARLGNKDEARKNAELARRWARTPQQKEQTEKIFRYLDRAKGASPR